jgi:molybdenum cofactor guanylyltransferase
MNIDDISMRPDGLALCADAAAIILAGGTSQRMKRDKSMLSIDGKPMVAHIHDQLTPHFKQTLISANDVEKYAFLGAQVVPDNIPGCGPLMGITSALAVSEQDLNFVTACDMPEVNMMLLQYMLRESEGYDAVIPIAEGQVEPLFGLYRKSVIDRFEAILAQGKRRIRDALATCNTRYIDVADTQALKNLNTPEDYTRFVAGEHDGQDN